MNKQAIFFDLGNTLVSYYHRDDFLPVLEASVQRCLDHLAPQGLDYEYATTLERAIAQDAGNSDHSVTPIEERLAAVFPEPVVADHMPDLVRAFMEPVFATARVLDDIPELLTTLQLRDIPLVLVSNTPWGSPSALWRSHLYDIGIAHFFRELVFCVDVGWRKPHPAIFQHALDKTGLQANDVLFVGDDPDWDMAGARDAGMEVVLAGPGLRERLLAALD